MALIMAKGFLLSMVRSGDPAMPPAIEKVRVVRKGVRLDRGKVSMFNAVCQYPRNLTIVPAAYIQTLFIGLLGRYITSTAFPLNPMGLIHTFQNISLLEPVSIKDSLDLYCSLQKLRPVEKGFELDFKLAAHRDGRPVWQGLSTFLVRTVFVQSKKKGGPDKESRLPVRALFNAEKNTGRLYARASGDYNPHHLSVVPARILGFKASIAHGMWSLARSLAEVTKVMPVYCPVSIDARFKLPVYLPACLALGYGPWNSQQTESGGLVFELRDARSGHPHIAGSILCPGLG